MTTEAFERFSAIIPTLQRSAELRPLVAQLAEHPLVGEVIVINNASDALEFPHENVRVLQQVQNIFVNPAWNLGAREAHFDWLAIINDDVRFEDAALTYAGNLLRRGRFAMVGPDKSCFLLSDSAAQPVSHRIATEMRLMYGTFMCLRRSDYVPIPDDIKIWGGDDWLFWSQRRPNAILVHTPFKTEMSTTSGSAEFNEFRQRERDASARHWKSVYGTRWWHRPAKFIEKIRMLRIAMRQVHRSNS